jgi:alkylation response protein AidB-like acyl-CoA dehydrogenase
VIEPLSLQPLPADAEALRADVRRFLDEALAGMAPDRRARSWLGFDAEFSRALGARGWVGLAAAVEMRSRASSWSRSCWRAARRCRRTGSPSGRARR